METDPVLHDIIIIGAGPCGLAVAARLQEHTPSALFTDNEHERYHWLKRHKARATVQKRRGSRRVVGPSRSSTFPSAGARKFSMLVLDSTADTWMARWNRLFEGFEIEYLRSPMFFHVDPSDRDGLLAFSHEKNREGEVLEIKGCVGRELSKHTMKKRQRQAVASGIEEINERDRKDYFNPSRTLFCDHCISVISRYDLSDKLIAKENVEDIRFREQVAFPDADRVFSIRTATGTKYARNVVLAVGATNTPHNPGSYPDERIEGACHSMQITKFPDPSVASKIHAKKRTNVVVIGGGLTSAQITDLAIRKGVTKVYHLLRSTMKVKPFDVDLEWVGKFANHEKAVFWSADTDEERLEFIKSARGGGSINPPFAKILRQHVASGEVELHQCTEISSKCYDSGSRTWRIETSPPVQLPPIDYIYYATGVQTDIATVPFLKSMLEDYPVKVVGGLPCVNHDLKWQDDVPLFVTGRLAALSLGPGAENLEGARMGAERVAWALQESLEDEDEIEKRRDCAIDGLGSFVSGVGNRFAAFGSGVQIDDLREHVSDS